MKLYLYYFLLIFTCWSCSSRVQHLPESVHGSIGHEAMVVSANPLASKVGAEILRKGGNAWDAAIAVKFALAVAYSVAGNIGGGGFAVYRAEDGTVGSLDFREKAPMTASKDMYLDANREVIDRLSLEGHMASGVPGSVDGMVRLYEEFGSLPWEELVQPAVNLARDGYTLTSQDAYNFNRARELFVKYSGKDIIFVKEGDWNQGDLFIQHDLAETLERIRDHGWSGFYEGITAKLIVDEMNRGDGIISHDDLQNYRSQWREPVIGHYRGHKIISMPPPSSGGVALVQLLIGAESFPIAKWGFNTANTIHVLTEIEKRVYADRATYMGDPDFFEVPVSMLTSDAYIDHRLSGLDLKNPTASQEIKEGKVDVIESIETTHFSIVDAQGNAVSVTTTLNSYFGCKVLVKGAGFFLNNEMDDFSVKAGVPNQFGLVGSLANEIRPQKRMLSSMTPTIVERDGDLFMVVGSPGGSTIITSVFQTIMNVIDHGMTMQQAINAPRVHHQWLPDRLMIEKNALSDEVIKKLESKGYQLDIRGTIGRVDAVLVRSDGTLEGGADGRGDDTAVGF